VFACVLELGLCVVEQMRDDEKRGQDHDAREVMFVHAGHRHNVSDIAWNHECPWLVSSVSDAEENIQVSVSVSLSINEREEKKRDKKKHPGVLLCL